MLVKFHSSTSGEIMMFADVARQLVAILGKEPLARGVITFEQLPVAIEAVSSALARARGEGPGAEVPGEPLPVSLAQRLVPFLELLQRTRADEGYVMWEASGAFGAS
jgi:hypothetical protein